MKKFEGGLRLGFSFRLPDVVKMALGFVMQRI